jgi:hypothetical protein
MERLMFQSTGVCSAVIQGRSLVSVPTNEDEDVEEEEEEEELDDDEERRSPLLPRLLLSLAPPYPKLHALSPPRNNSSNLDNASSAPPLLSFDLRFRKLELLLDEDDSEEGKGRRLSLWPLCWLLLVVAFFRKLLPGLKKEVDEEECLPMALGRMMLDFSGRYVRKGRGLVYPPVVCPPGGQEEERINMPRVDPLAFVRIVVVLEEEEEEDVEEEEEEADVNADTLLKDVTPFFPFSCSWACAACAFINLLFF